MKLLIDRFGTITESKSRMINSFSAVTGCLKYLCRPISNLTGFFVLRSRPTEEMDERSCAGVGRVTLDGRQRVGRWDFVECCPHLMAAEKACLTRQHNVPIIYGLALR